MFSVPLLGTIELEYSTMQMASVTAPQESCPDSMAEDTALAYTTSTINVL